MYISLSLSVLMLIFSKKLFMQISKKLIYTFLSIFYINFALLSFYFFINYLSGDGINDAILFHLRFGIKGFGKDEYILPLLVLLLINIVLLILLKQFSENISKKFSSHLSNIIPFGILLASIFFNPFYKDIYMLFNEQISESHIDGNLFFEQDIFFHKDKKNVIFIYLEQVERTYLDEDIFPGLTPNLKRLEQSSLNFTNIDSLELQIGPLRNGCFSMRCAIAHPSS